MGLTEKQVEIRLRKMVQEIGGMALKFISPGHSGVPDRLVFLPGGKIILVELKKPKGKLTLLQEKMRNRFIKLGFKYYVIDSYEKVEEMISEIQST